MSAKTLAHRSREFRVLFVYPNLYLMNMMPPGVAILSALLKARDIEVALFDTTYYEWRDPRLPEGLSQSSDQRKELALQVRPFNLQDRGVVSKTTDVFEDLEQVVATFRPNLLAMSVVEDTFPLGVRLLDRVRHLGIPTVVGGVFPTFAPQLAIDPDSVDMICVGEGEGALVELCERMALARDYSDVRNLWVKGPDGHVAKNPLRPLVEMDRLPMPDFEIFEPNRIYRPMAGKIYRMIPIESHRGCPFSCRYCNSPSQSRLSEVEGAGKFFRRKGIDRIGAELSYLIDRFKAEYVYFTADTFLGWTSRQFRDFARMYGEFRLPFWCQTRPETITEEIADTLKEIGCHRMSIGIEHGNEAFRREMVDRRIGNEDLVTRTNLAGTRIPLSVNNITGFPGETRELAFDTIRLNRRLHVDTMNCYTYMPYHGTAMRDEAVERGYLRADAVACSLTAGSVLDMPGYSRDEIAGVVRTFSLYARLPESEWPRIRRAEIDDEEGNAIFAELRQEYVERFFNDGKPTFG